MPRNWACNKPMEIPGNMFYNPQKKKPRNRAFNTPMETPGNMG